MVSALALSALLDRCSASDDESDATSAARLWLVTSFVCILELPAPPESAWAFVVAHGESIEPLRFEPQGAQGVGTLNRLSGRIGGVPIRGLSRTTAWDPPNRCVFESVKPSWPVRTRITETFDPSTAGTRHSILYEIVPRGIVGKLAAPVFSKLMERSRKLYQQRLRDALDANSGS